MTGASVSASRTPFPSAEHQSFEQHDSDDLPSPHISITRLTEVTSETLWDLTNTHTPFKRQRIPTETLDEACREKGVDLKDHKGRNVVPKKSK